MYWLLVLIAGLLEVVWASALKHADSLMDWIGIFLLIAVSFLMLIRSYKKIPIHGCRVYRFCRNRHRRHICNGRYFRRTFFNRADILFGSAAVRHFRNEDIYERK